MDNRRHIGNGEWDRQTSGIEVTEGIPFFCHDPECKTELLFGTLGKGSRIEVICRSCMKKSTFPQGQNPDETDGELVKCNNCNRPIFAGVITGGTAISVKCRGCNFHSQFIKPQ